MEDEWECESYEEGEELYYDDDGAFGVGCPLPNAHGGGDVR